MVLADTAHYPIPPKCLYLFFLKHLFFLSAQNLCTVLYIIVFSHLVRCLFPLFITVTPIALIDELKLVMYNFVQHFSPNILG